MKSAKEIIRDCGCVVATRHEVRDHIISLLAIKMDLLEMQQSGSEVVGGWVRPIVEAVTLEIAACEAWLDTGKEV